MVTTSVSRVDEENQLPILLDNIRIVPSDW